MTLTLAQSKITISPIAVVSCPARDFKARRACASCPECEFFKGLGVMSAEGTWSDRYAIICAHPIERRTQAIEVLEE